jgi:CubicO group peptidase (beta-lactamase class C family)
VPTRRSLLTSTALAPLLLAGRRSVLAQVETPGEVTEEVTAGTPVSVPQSSELPDLTGVTPLPLTGDRLVSFEAYITTALAELEVPGTAVAVIQGGETAFLQGFGVRELGRPDPVTPDTLLRIGSVTKSFSSLLAATLVDAGRLSWDTPLQELLPDFAVADAELTPRLTVKDAFCACSGLPRRDLEFIFDAHALTPERMIASMAKLPLTAPYGTTYQYSNQMVGPEDLPRASPTVDRHSTWVAPTRSHCGSGYSTPSECPVRPTPSLRSWPVTTMPSRMPRTSLERCTRSR